MKISYNWLKWYIPEIPEAEKLQDVFTYHLCEVEGIEKKGDDIVFDINILPNRAHDLLSHLGVAKEIASLLNIEFKKDGPWGNSLKDRPLEELTNLKIKIETDKCRRYMGRIVRNIKIGASPDWVQKHLESIGQRSINNIVDATNIVMYDCGQPCHAFDLDKLFSRTVLGDLKKDSPLLLIRQAKEGEKMTTLDDKEVELSSIDMVIADEKNILAIAGVKGGKLAEVDENTKNILIEVANFDPVSVRKTSKKINVLTDSSKRFENDLSPEVVAYAMREISGLLVEYGKFDFEEIVDIYPEKQKVKTLSFSSNKISKILGVNISEKEIEDVLKRYNFEHRPLPNLPLTKGEEKEGGFEIIIPPTRLDLEIEEDMAEEIGRILGYDKIKEKLPEINWKPKINETYAKIFWARNKLLNEGYSEVMTYSFCNKGELEVLASASDKKFLRMNLSDGLKESLKLNQLNAPLLEIDEIKIFEIGTIFKKDGEEMHIAYADKKEIKEMSLEEFVPQGQSLKEFPQGLSFKEQKFKPWSSFPFIFRDIAVWVPEEVESNQVFKVIKENAGDMVMRGPELFDEFKKPASTQGGDGKISYAFRLVFQSYDRTLTDTEINEIMTKITNKIKEKNGWQVR